MSNLVVATNTQGLNSHRSLKVVSEKSGKASEKLSSGYRINRSADDAAGLAISEKMRNQIKGLNMASKNASDGISMIQTADGALAEVGEMIKRIRELTVQGANDTNVSADRDKMAEEIFQLTKEIWATEDKTEFNGMKILKSIEQDPTINPPPSKQEPNGDFIGGKYLQIGANENQGITLDISLKSLRSPYDLEKVSFLFATHSMLNHAGLSLKGLKGDNHVAGTSYNYTGDDDEIGLAYVGAKMNNGIRGYSHTEWISNMIGNVDIAADNINKVRATLGAYQNRLEHTTKNLDISHENLSAAESRIRDTDMAKEMMEFTKSNILSQAGMSMLAQANQSPNSVVSILR